MLTKVKNQITPIKMRYYSKISSANQSSIFRNSSQHFCSVPTFSSYYQTEGKKLLEYIDDAPAIFPIAYLGVGSIIQTLKMQDSEKYKRIKNDRKVNNAGVLENRSSSLWGTKKGLLCRIES